MTEPAVDLGFVLLAEAVLPEPGRLVKAAAEFGLGRLTEVKEVKEGDPSSEVQVFRLPAGSTLMVALIPMPHPNVGSTAVGWAFPDREQAVAAPAHLIVSGLGLGGPPMERDGTMARLLAAVLQAGSGVAAMLGDGVTWIARETFVNVVGSCPEGEFPLPACVDVTVAGEDRNRASLLTHGMQRYGREELYVTTPRRKGGEALAFVWDIAQWLLSIEKAPPTGDTVGRTAEEKVRVKRVPSPTGRGSKVVRLDLE